MSIGPPTERTDRSSSPPFHELPALDLELPLGAGPIDTEMTQALPDKRQAELTAAVPLGRFGNTDEIAATVVFLASPEAGYITGAVIPVDGGLGM